MDLFSLGFVLLILVASGGIAYAADILGKKLGKKRLSLRFRRWSLRPKHVASLGTAGMGVVVSLLTILFVAAVSRDAREWLQRGRGLLVDIQRLRKERDVEEGKVQGLTNQVRSLEAQNLTKEQELQAKSRQNEDLDQKGAVLQGKVTRLGKEADRLKDQLSGTLAKLQQNRQALVASEKELATVVAQEKKTRESLVVAESALTAEKASLVTEKKNLAAITKQKNDAQLQSLAINFRLRDLEKKIEQYKVEVFDREKQVESLKIQTANLVAERNEAEGKLSDAQANYRLVSSQLDEAGARLMEFRELAESQQSFLKGATRSSRVEPLTFSKDEEVSRIVVPAGADRQTAAKALDLLLLTARVEAQRRGARGHKSGGEDVEVADVFNRQDPKSKAVVTGDSLKRLIVSKIAGRRDEGVLVATSSLNAFGGEPVSLEIELRPNPVVYRRNQPVADARIDGSLDEDKILEQFSLFVRSRVREQATQDKMILRPNDTDPFGQVSALEMLNVVRDVKKTGRAVRVQAFAEADTRAADPLKLGFRVR